MKFNCILFTMLFFAFGTMARSNEKFNTGGSVGNGGGAWVCRNADETLQWAKLVDFYEATNEFDLDISIDNQNNPDQQVKNILNKTKSININFYYAVKKALLIIKPKIKFISGSNLAVIDDALFRIAPSASTCKNGNVNYEQLANYTDYDRILVDQEIFNSLTKSEQAGLFLHEAIYKLERERQEAKNSVQTRLIVGYLFSQLPISQYAQYLQSYEFQSGVSVCDICAIHLQAQGNFSEGLARFTDGNNKWGYMDRLGEVVISPKFDDVGDFRDGSAPVLVFADHFKKLWRFINKEGVVVISDIFYGDKPLAMGSGLKSGIIIKDGLEYKAVINSFGEFIVAPTKDILIGGLSEGVFPVSNSLGCKYFDPKGLVILDLKYESCQEFSEGLAAVRKGQKVGYIDHSGQLALPLKFSTWSHFNNGLAPQRDSSGKFGYINKSGVYELAPQFTFAGEFSNGLSVVRAGRYFSLMDEQGKTGGSFDEINLAAVSDKFAFRELIPVKLLGHWGYANRSGKLIIDFQFDQAENFYEGFALTNRGYVSFEMIND